MTQIKGSLADSYVYRWEKNEPRYLLLRRQKEKYYGGLWQGVAGQIQNSETAYQTIIRELQEETGLTPVRMFVIEQVITFYENHRDQITMVPVFGIEVDSKDVVLSEEHSDYRWLDIESAKSRLSWHQQKEVMALLHQMITTEDSRLKWLEIDLK